MKTHLSNPVDSIQLLKPLYPSKTLLTQYPHFLSFCAPCKTHVYRTKLRIKNLPVLIDQRKLRISAFRASGSDSVIGSTKAEEDDESAQLFEKLKDAERQRINKLEELENKANMQLERQLVMASYWSRALLSIRGKLKGTEWDPENSHRIEFSDFWRLLNSNNVQFLEYSNYGQTISVILPYYRDGKMEGIDGIQRKILFFGVMRWTVCQLIVGMMFGTTEVYSTVATTVIWSMRLALSIVLYLWIDSIMRPIYANKSTRLPLERRALGSLGKSRAKFISAEETTGVTFDDFAGQEYIKRELQEIVRILKNDEEFQDKGIYSPKGVLLHGPPGTGKTLLAKAIAGEAGLPFFAANGTDFVEMFVGVAASRVKDLFASARSFAPSIIFIDEIDAIGSKRGGPDIGGGGAEREQGLLQILTELDGFKSFHITSATNRLDILDPALLRKGRFEQDHKTRVIEEEMFGVDNVCWISGKATLEASKRTEFLILQTGMTAFGKAYYRNQGDLVPNLAAKLEALRDEYMRYAVEKCSSVLREYHSAVETITDVLLEKGEIKAGEIWDIYNRAPRIPQYSAIIYYQSLYVSFFRILGF
ncbi:hypothetical protein I3760_03G115600 [Carya illinoinensis]|nr:hypothetical protein I3760_03G115600 [Carya illinoinensis]